jgi:hypothetical protein
MVGGMQTPKQPNLMSQIVIYKMGKFPYDITIKEPVPGHGGLEGGIFLKKAYANGGHGNGDETTNESVEDIDQKYGLIDFGLGFFMNQPHNKLQYQKQGQYGLNDRYNTIIGQKGNIITAVEDLKKIFDAKKIDNFIPKGLK